eukprot:TRINITY_DN14670_c0_g1_i1.p1 TRINITY_DN14670_c0_g1~~TRINITY_DN14670_c0_g1_i1.p1  ORF type:complete len:131 (-),score=29.98 TRINITY_DN14670_c0_g1_i1:60-452(-)
MKAIVLCCVMLLFAGSAVLADLKADVQEVVNNNAVVVYSKSYCPYCKRTKALFQQLGVNAVVTELDLAPNGIEIQQTLLEITGQRTVPNVFIGGKHIGGADATAALHATGQLRARLQEAGVILSEQKSEL